MGQGQPAGIVVQPAVWTVKLQCTCTCQLLGMGGDAAFWRAWNLLRDSSADRPIKAEAEAESEAEEEAEAERSQVQVRVFSCSWGMLAQVTHKAL